MENITAKSAAEISISVVSHGQIDLVAALLHDIGDYCRAVPVELILTLNLEEVLPFVADSLSFPVKVVRNATIDCNAYAVIKTLDESIACFVAAPSGP
jgi:hypothetical protein